MNFKRQETQIGNVCQVPPPGASGGAGGGGGIGGGLIVGATGQYEPSP